MCGIAGYTFLKRTNDVVDLSLLDKMQKILLHRGPDGYRLWVDERKQIGFAHRRLSILDLSDAGFQPMHNNDNTITVMCNGEIYNHPELRKELETKGYYYKSNSDTETILHAYQEWGIDCLQKLNGMFAIAIYDHRKEELYLIRDRIGIKPLYFSVSQQILSFTSEIKALWALPWLNKQVNPRGLYHYLTFMVSPAPLTIYKDIYKLPAGFYLKVDKEKNVTFKQWYNLLNAPRLPAREFDNQDWVVQELRTLLRNSIKQQTLSDVPYGVFLSGGIDSSLNVALMSEFTNRVKTFTVSFSDGPEYSEVEWARLVAKRFNTDHHEILISEKEAFEFYQTMVYHQDEPLADCVCIPLYYVAKLLKDSGVTVVQVGEGSDELFCGYNTYAQYIDIYNKFWRPSEKFIPAFTKKTVAQIFKQLFPNKIVKQALLNQWAENRSLFWSGALAFPEGWKSKFITNLQVDKMYDPIVQQMYAGFNQEFDSYAVVDYHLRQLRRYLPQADFLTSMIWLELQQRLPELLLMRVDKMCMATSVEGRVPFLDHRIVEFAMQIPSDLKYKNGITKYILKKVAQDILPAEVIYRKKMGFAAPTTRWLKEGTYFKQYFMDSVKHKTEFWSDYLNVPEITKLFEINLSDRQEFSLQLWTLQNVIASF